MIANPYRRKYYETHKDSLLRAARKYHFRIEYGITIEEFDRMVSVQNGACAICGDVPERLRVDHDHSTGKIRGLLCHSCNIALGHFKDSGDILLAAVKYLQK